MKLNRSLILVLVCGLFSACSPSHQARPDDAGGMEGGGGNSYNGKPLESYIQDVTKTPAFIEKVQPLLESLKKNDASAHSLITVALRKSWFFIPGELKGLPNEKIGSAVPTEQVALQSFKEVWLNTKLFNNMSIDEQGKLLIHEVLMGLRLLKYNSRYEQCMALTSFPSDCENSDRRAKSPSDLNTDDYADIRAAVKEVWDSKINDHVSWNDVVARNNFSMSFYIFKLKSVRTELSGRELLITLRTAEMTKSLPKFGFSEELIQQAEDDKRDIVVSDGKCRFTITSDVNNGKFTLTGTKYGENYVFTVDGSYTYNKSAFWFNGRVAYSAYASDGYLRKPGDIRNDVALFFDQSNNLIGFQTSQWTLIDDSTDAEGRFYETMLTGSTMVCLNQPSIVFLR